MRWLLCDYGQVLCLAPPADDWNTLVGAVLAAGWSPPGAADAFEPVYWAHREAYDRGDLTAPAYWAATIGHAVDSATLESIIAADRAMWLHPNPAALEATHRAAARGLHLAVFSNAPVEVAEGIDSRPWLAAFEPRFYSCFLRSVKPEPAAYLAVLDRLGASPADVVFFDDRPANVAAAIELGIDARVFTDPTQLDDV